MKVTGRHRRIARALWESGGHVEEVARAERVRADTLRRWLGEPEFRVLLSEDALEPLLQATSAVLRWAPAAVARLISDLDGESAGDARQAAREILKLAIDAQRELGPPRESPGEAGRQPGETALGLEDPFSCRIAGLSDAQLQRVLTIVNEQPGATKGGEA